MNLAIAVVWAAVCVLFVERLNVWAHRWLSLRESVTTAHEQETIPEDLQAFALMESEPHAQDAVLAVMRERFEKYRDWNRVRAAMGVAAKD